MSDPQVWAVIGVFATIMVGGMTLMTTLLTRTLNVAIGGLRAEMSARFEAVDARFEAIDARFQAVDARFNAVDARFDSIDKQIAHLDRDVSALIHRALDD